MSFLRSVWSDLVEKRLWPVALALVAALVAVPVLLGGSSSGVEPLVPVGATGLTGPASALGALGGRTAVQLASGAPVRRDRAGAVRDPFKQHPLPAGAAAAVSTVTAAAAAQASTSAPSSSSGGGKVVAPPAGSPAGTSTTTTPAVPAPGALPTGPKPLQLYTAVVRFGPIGAHRPRKDVARLAPLPSTEAPFLVFVGALGEPRTAVFLLSSDVTATGDGTCRPRPSSCETVELHKGESERLVVAQDDGTTQTWILQLVEVVKGDGPGDEAIAQAAKATSAKAKARAKARADAAAKSAATGSSRYRYDKTTGLLRRVPVVKGKTSTATAGAAFAAVAGTGDTRLLQFSPAP